LAGNRAVVRNAETLLDVTFQAQIVPGWIVQPDFQYIWNPGGHAPINNAPRPAPFELALARQMLSILIFPHSITKSAPREMLLRGPVQLQGLAIRKSCCAYAIYENPFEIALQKLRKIGTFAGRFCSYEIILFRIVLPSNLTGGFHHG
jgi:hypothetical protein